MPSSRHPRTLFPYPTLFRSEKDEALLDITEEAEARERGLRELTTVIEARDRSEEHTSELQSLRHLVCRLPAIHGHSFPTRRSSDLRRMKHYSISRKRRKRENAGCANSPRSSKRETDRKSTRLNSSHLGISYAVFPPSTDTLSLPDALPI